MIDLHIQASNPPLGEQLLVAIVGPLVSAVLGVGVIGFILWKLSEKANSNRSAVENARATHEFEGTLRQEILTSGLTDTTALYLATQHYWRTKDDTQLPDDEKLKARSALDQQYLKSRAAMQVLEIRLEALFETEQPATEWHKLDDLLTVRYMQLTGKATEQLYRINAQGYESKEHSGLTVSELKNVDLLLRGYHQTVKDAAGAVMGTPLRRLELK